MLPSSPCRTSARVATGRRSTRSAGPLGARPPARRSYRRRPQPIVFTLVGAEQELADALLAGIESPLSGSTFAVTPARIRGSARQTSCRSSRSSPATWSARATSLQLSARGSAWSSVARLRLRAARPRPGLLSPRWPDPSAGARRRRRRGSRLRAGEAPRFCRRGDSRSRAPLIAFNVNLRGALEIARDIAAVVRERGGGFPGSGRSASTCRAQASSRCR